MVYKNKNRRPTQFLYLDFKEKVLLLLGKNNWVQWLLKEILKPCKDGGIYKLEFGSGFGCSQFFL